MGYTVSVNHPHFPEGHIFNVGGLDRVPNGGSLEVDDEMERLFIMSNGQTVEDGFTNDAVISVSGSSALDDDERNSLLEAYAPQTEEEVEAVDLGTVEEEETPSWLGNRGNTPDEGDDQ